MSGQPQPLDLLLEDDPPPCPHCGGQGLLLARWSHSWANERGQEVEGRRESVLCPECHRANPAAAELIALFAVDDRLDDANLPLFAQFVSAWAESERARTVDLVALNDEAERWWRGEL